MVAMKLRLYVSKCFLFYIFDTEPLIALESLRPVLNVRLFSGCNVFLIAKNAISHILAIRW